MIKGFDFMAASSSSASPMPAPPKPARVVSLDALRGFDLFLLVGLGPIVGALARVPLIETWCATPTGEAVLRHFEHVSWEGFVTWDLIMPLFLFMAGAAIPFSLARYTNRENGRPTLRLFWRIFRRILLLWIFGMIAQGNLLDLKLDGLRLYSNTLQAIAAGYLIAAGIYLLTGKTGQILIAILLIFGYWSAMNWVTTADGCGGGSYSTWTNLAEFIDRAVLGRWQGGVSFAEDGTWTFSQNYHYTWILSSLTFGVTTILGMLVGEIVKAGRRVTVIPLAIERDEMARSQEQAVYAVQEAPLLRTNDTPQARRPDVITVPSHFTALKLLGVGVILTALGWFWGAIPAGDFGYCPIVKHIWTPSMTLFAAGISTLLMALFYEVIDVLNFRFGATFLVVIGMNSIAAYMLRNLFGGTFSDIARRLLHGTEQYLGAWYAPVIELAAFALLWSLLWTLWRKKCFLRV